MKILLIRFSSIGDIVLTTPVIRCLALQLQAEVHFITKQSFVPLLRPNPYLKKVIGIDTTTTKLKTIVPVLQEENYDYVIDLHQNWRSWYLRGVLGVRSFGFDKLTFKKWLFTQFKINRLPSTHIVDRYLATTKTLGVQNDFQGLDYFIPTTDYIPATKVDPQLVPNHYICFVIGAAHFTKRLPTSKIIAICRQLTLPIVLIGGPAEQTAAIAIQQATGPTVINACGAYNLHQSAAIVDQAQWVIAHDTGFMHIAAALRKPIISIWGNTVPAFGMTPYLPQKEPPTSVWIQNENLGCRPCDKIGKKACPKGHFQCMQSINIQEIVKACS
jgi:ADP-heptose:LPS heptosyltransferase